LRVEHERQEKIRKLDQEIFSLDLEIERLTSQILKLSNWSPLLAALLINAGIYTCCIATVSENVGIVLLIGCALLLEFGLASLSGGAHLADLNLGARPLAKDQAVQDAWDVAFRHYTTVSRFLYELDEADVERVQAELEAIMRPYLRSATHEVLCHQEYLTLCGDLTGRPVSAYSTTYPPDTVFGYMANQLCKGHQAVLVTLKGLRHRVHVVTFHHSGDTVSGTCLREMVEAAEARLGCRPRRRTEQVYLRIELLEAQIAQKREWIAAQQALIREQIERQVRLGDQLQAIRPQLTELEAHYAGKRVHPHSQLAQAHQRKAGWERQLRSALEQEGQARRALEQHQQRLETLITTRDALLNWLAQLEADNATCPNPVRIRWLLDGGFGDAANVAYLIEMGYDVYTMATTARRPRSCSRTCQRMRCGRKSGLALRRWRQSVTHWATALTRCA